MKLDKPAGQKRALLTTYLFSYCVYANETNGQASGMKYRERGKGLIVCMVTEVFEKAIWGRAGGVWRGRCDSSSALVVLPVLDLANHE